MAKTGTELKIVGVQYQTGVLKMLQSRKISIGSHLDLVREPDNPYDKNAVKVLWDGQCIGYLSSAMAKKYSKLIVDGRIVKATFSGIKKKKNWTDAYVKVTYEEDSGIEIPGLCGVKYKSGVYAISGKNGRKYIGSSKDIRKRLLSHFRDLYNGCHSNKLLQYDYDQFGTNWFSVSGLVESKYNLIDIERKQYDEAIKTGTNLYNVFTPGQEHRPSGGDRPLEEDSEVDKSNEINLDSSGYKYSGNPSEKFSGIFFITLFIIIVIGLIQDFL